VTMETRAILATVLAVALFVVYQTFLVPPQEPPRAEKPQEQAPAVPSPPQPAQSAKAAPTPTPAPPSPTSAPQIPRPPQRTAKIETPLFRAELSSEAGKVQEWVLHYRGEKALAVVGELGLRGLTLGRPGRPAEPIAFRLEPEAVKVAGDQASNVVMTGDDGSGIRVSQTATFSGNDYTLDLTIRLENTQAGPQDVIVRIPLVTPVQLPTETSAAAPVQWPTEAVWQVEGNPHREYYLSALTTQRIDGEWIGLGNIYYLSALIPRTKGMKLVLGAPADGRAEVGLEQVVSLGPGQSWEGKVAFYSGPKEYDRLKAHGLAGAIDFGGFPLPRAYGGLPMEWLGIPVLLVMHFFYRYVGNYGVAIILLTVITKVLFYPLTVKSMSSMKKMQAIQPQVNALRAKHKSDPQRAQREMMDLYKREGVNPVGGCLPMVVQVPIFYALYIALSVSVELQNAPFVCFGRVFGIDLWICDLASQDPTYILPVIMGITMFIQQKMTPVTGDPRQAKMMLVMPFIFTFMFFNLPSGLVLYWSVSNLLQIGQQYLMNRSTPARTPRREAKDAARA
jgi:YidC/Oxa1 family membrane protein insertase